MASSRLKLETFSDPRSQTDMGLNERKFIKRCCSFNYYILPLTQVPPHKKYVLLFNINIEISSPTSVFQKFNNFIVHGIVGSCPDTEHHLRHDAVCFTYSSLCNLKFKLGGWSYASLTHTLDCTMPVNIIEELLVLIVIT